MVFLRGNFTLFVVFISRNKFVVLFHTDILFHNVNKNWSFVVLHLLQSKQNGGATASSGVEPKALIDNPNAAATKANSLIKPRPLKVGQDSPSPGKYCALCETD